MSNRSPPVRPRTQCHSNSPEARSTLRLLAAGWAGTCLTQRDVQAPAAPPRNDAQNYYPFLDFTWANCTVGVVVGPTHWSDNDRVRHAVLELVRPPSPQTTVLLPVSPHT